MKMEIFEYTITDGNFDIAGCNDIDLAKEVALMLATEKHCDIDIINAFTGEVVYSLETIIHITMNCHGTQIEKTFETREREW
jgi:hypothetical protein